MTGPVPPETPRPRGRHAAPGGGAGAAEPPAQEPPAQEPPAREAPGREVRGREVRGRHAAQGGGAGEPGAAPVQEPPAAEVPAQEVPAREHRGRHAAPSAGPPGTASPTAAAGAESLEQWRAAREAERHRRTRNSVLVAVVVASVMLLAWGAVWWASARSEPDRPGASPTASASPAAPRQDTLLLQVRDDTARAVDGVLLGVGGTPDRSVLLFAPARLAVDPPGAGTMTLADTARLGDTLASVNSLSDLLGVRIDGGWRLERRAFAGLVDAVGGVQVDVTREITRANADGTTTVLVPKGRHLLDGPLASRYVTSVGPTEADAARVARFSTVLVEVLRQLPDDPLRMRQLITSLGATAPSTVPTEQVADFLLRLRAGVVAGQADVQSLPVKPYDTRAGTTYRLDFAPAGALVRELLPEALTSAADGGSARVLVQNGVGTPGLGAKARDRLVDAGFVYVNGANAERFGYRRTLVVVPGASQRERQQGADVARALRVPVSSVRVAATGQTLADVIVVLGADFRP